jgi:YHS domain-containing protein
VHGDGAAHFGEAADDLMACAYVATHLPRLGRIAMTIRSFRRATFGRAMLGLSMLVAMGAFQSARAGEAFVDSTKFAVSGHDVVAYFDLPASSSPRASVPGNRKFTAVWNGAAYAFASAENRDKFQTDPARYAPQFDGHCAWAAGQGYKAPASPNVWRIVEGKLYLNYSHAIRQKWESGTQGQIGAGVANWRKLDSQPAATGNAEDYEPKAAPLP